MPTEPPFDPEDFLRERRQALQESVRYFEPANRPERERWVVCELLQNLGLKFDSNSVRSSSDDPPDVLFQDARFEVKEILDFGRKRHREFKAAATRAATITDPQELLNQFTPKDITPIEITSRVSVRLNELQLKYPVAVRRSLDCLFYVNLMEHFLKAGPIPPTGHFVTSGWRSVSAVCGWGAFVFYCHAEAPTFLRERSGQLIHREFK